MNKAWSHLLYKELDISDKTGFNERLRKDIKKNPSKFRLVCSECKVAAVIYARGEKREYFTTFETTSVNYVPHRQNCSYSLPSAIANGFGSQFSNVHVALADKEIVLDFTSFLNQETDNLDKPPSGTENSNDKEGKSGKNRTPGSAGATTSKLRKHFSTFSGIVDFFRVNLCAISDDMDYNVMIKGVQSKPAPIKEVFLDSFRTRKLIKPPLTKLNDRFFYGHVKDIKIVNNSYRVVVKSNKGTNGFSTFITKVVLDQYVSDNELIPSEDSLFVCFGSAATTPNPSGGPDYLNISIADDCFRFFSNIAKDGHSVRSKFEVDIDDFISGSRILREFSHVVPGSLHGYNAQWNVDRCRQEFQPNNGVDLFYIPDFILQIEGENPIIIECFGFDSSIGIHAKEWEPLIQYREKKERKINFFQNLPDYDFIAIYPNDVMEEGKMSWKKAHQFFSEKLGLGSIPR